MNHPASYSNKINDEKVQCTLCPHYCTIAVGGTGICKVRKNIDGKLYSLNYGKLASISLDPIEKKPLYRFHPGKSILSIGTFGCNLKCSFCQNWGISQKHPDTYSVKPDEIVEKANKLIQRGNIGIAYTYNEPTVWYEFVYNTAKLNKKKGMLNVLVTNGFINREPLMELLPYIDAMNIDVKAYTEEFYNEICKASLKNIIETVEIAARECHVEITTLIIPGLNDSIEEIGELSRWLSSISPEIPLHLSRFFPNYKMQDRPRTTKESLIDARKKALEYLKYVYLGNI
jgi:pyruvate formate lyase activating enzyme